MDGVLVGAGPAGVASGADCAEAGTCSVGAAATGWLDEGVSVATGWLDEGSCEGDTLCFSALAPGVPEAAAEMAAAASGLSS